ncbi:hypothetical protein SAMN02745121_00232 [Nannocystis exedens]|uniref:Uncharacterized protein n=1 Tax=Nannocystis exedens TaxID=54 RepID=A0A1I1SS81_9BACT|nr:hypothetical protein NAEX_08804 [Nannocystis exedens]SFD49315.1 hypothetical protein SAMN02745121_00232 [Nannocystis exedens]
MTLWCPVTLSLGDPLFPDSLSTLRLWYRDPDGTGTRSRVTAQLHFRPANSSTLSTIGSLIDSNTSSVMTSDRLTSSVMTSNRLTNDFADHTLTDSLYFVKVTSFRDEALENVAFHGIDLGLDPST